MKLKDVGIELRVAYGDPPEKEKGKEDNVELDSQYGRKVRNLWLIQEKLLFQLVIREIIWADLVIVEQANKYLVNYILLLLSLVGKKKVAYWGHGIDKSDENKLFSKMLKRRLIDCVDWWFSYTPSTTKYLKKCGVSSTNITTVYNSVDTAEFRNMLDNITPEVLMEARKNIGLVEYNHVALYCGTLSKEKKIEFLIKASSLIKNVIPAFELIVIGSGPEKRLIMQVANDYTWIHYVGARFGQEKALYFRMAQVFLHPGAIGLAILDSFAAGLPIITTDIQMHGPEIDYLEEGENGLMTAHDVDRYAEEVASVLKDRGQLARMQGYALESGRRYSIEEMAENFKNGIVDCLLRRS